jgi:esterase/lipase superfamily enzyme/tetratricopeptide (TPR) repeat protein
MFLCLIGAMSDALCQVAPTQDNQALARASYRAARYVEAEIAAKNWLEDERKTRGKGEWADISSALTLLRNIQLARGDVGGAEATLDALVQELQNGSDYGELVRTLYRGNRYPEAEQAAKAWVRAERTNSAKGEWGDVADALDLLRTVQISRGDSRGAEATLKELVRLSEKKKDYRKVAYIYYAAKRYVEAEGAARAWLENERTKEAQGDETNRKQALQLLAEIQIARRNFKGAEISLKNLLQLLKKEKASDLEVATVLDQLGLVYQALGKQDAAKEMIKRSWELRSKMAELSDACILSADVAGEVSTECRGGGGKRKRGKRARSKSTSGGEQSEQEYLSSDQAAQAMVPVFFGTDRKKREPTGDQEQSQSSGIRVRFDGNRNHQITLGKAMVTVPRKHIQGQVERPWVVSVAGFTAYEEAENPNNHFVIKSLDIYTKDRFLAEANHRLSQSKSYKKQAFVFVHGYNVEFDSAIFRTAQIAFDLQFDGPAFLYSWPSSGDPSAYQGDRSSATQAYAYIEEFLRLVVEETTAETVHVVAHSMGNVPLLNALENIARAGGFKDARTVGQLILAAPDVDRDEFANRLRALESIRKGGTLYASRQDKAIQVSRVWNGGVPRAGDVPPDGPVISKAIYTIDASYLGTQVFAINHSGYAESRDLLRDISELFRFGKQPPKARWGALRVMETSRGSYWQYLP